MTRPRQPFGAEHPGRLPATMLKVLAAEISDPQRLRRGKQYAHDGSVLDIIVEPGAVTCEIQGSRPTPYIARIEVSSGDGMPLRRDLRISCSCPDDAELSDHACKHVVAALFAFSNEVLIEPALLDVWRQQPAHHPSNGTAPTAAAVTTSAIRGRRHLTLVHSDTTPAHGVPAQAVVASLVSLEHLLSCPAGSELPSIPPLDPLDPIRPQRNDLAAVLIDALGHLHVDWD
jgi:hypothetical protein